VSQINDKKRILFTTWGSFGDIHPHMALAIALKERGHNTVVATSEIYREKIEAERLEFAPLRPDLPAPDSERAAEMIRKLSDTFGGPEYLFREILMPHLRDTYADMLEAATANGGADLIVSHQVPLTARIVAEVTGIKWLSSVLFPIAFASIYDPPTPPQFPAIRSLAALNPEIARLLMGVGKWWMSSWVEPIHALRRELGLAPIENPIFEGQHSSQLVLALFSRVLSDMQPDFPPNTVITGFPFYDRDDALGAVSPELDRFLDDGDPPIMFTLGSSLVWLPGDFYKFAVDAAEKLGRRALLLTGDKRNLPSEKLPTTVGAFDYAPHHYVMPRSLCTVHQGGIGTTGQALRSGRPMLVVPHGQDQPDNARRCVALGVGRSLPVSGLTSDTLLRELSQLLTNPSYAEKAADIAAKVRSENGTTIACDLIEMELNRP
jgi:rhamnosyltransferase subunit B